MSTEITKEMWLKRCADRLIERAKLPPDVAHQWAGVVLTNILNDLTELPEVAADDEMECWEE